MVRALNSVAILLSVAALSACATTRVVSTKPGNSGELMVREGLIGDARKDAQLQMQANCGKKKPVITEEGEVVVGKTTSASTTKEKWGISATGSEDDKREWRVKYKCSNAG